MFGELVKAKWDRVLHTVAADMAGIVARPLYVCTALQADGQPCMAMASMSPLMQHKQDHEHFRCKRCKTNSAAPASDEAPLRVLRLYVQVLSDTGRTVTMRTAPMHVMLQAPRANTDWAIGQDAPDDISILPLADPVTLKTRYKTMYKYDAFESHFIWACAARYQDLAPN